MDNLEMPKVESSILDRIRYLMKLSRLTQARFADRIGSDAATVSRVLKSTHDPSEGFINKIVANMGVSKRWLTEGLDVPFPRNGNTPSGSGANYGAPVYDIDVTAGARPLSRMFTDEYVIGRINLPGLDSELPIVRVSGNSMTPRLKPGCYISIRPMPLDAPISWGRIYVVVLADYRFVKYVRRHSSPSKVILHSANPEYDDIEINRSDIQGLYLVENVINNDFLA